MMDEQVNLWALELTAEQRELLVASIMARATPELARRAAEDVSPMLVLSEWVRPALAAAAVLGLICMSVLAQHDFGGSSRMRGLAEALNVPEPVNEWIVADRGPTVEDLFVAMETENR